MTSRFEARPVPSGGFSVAFVAPNGLACHESTHPTREAAEARAAFLNGGERIQ